MSHVDINENTGIYFSNKRAFAKAISSIKVEAITDETIPVTASATATFTATSTASGNSSNNALMNAINAAIKTVTPCNSSNNVDYNYSNRIIIVFNYQNQKDLNTNKAFFQFLIDKNIFVDVDYYAYPEQTTTNDEVTVIYENLYTKGYRFAIGFETGQNIIDIMLPFLKTYKDFVYFNLFSTNDIYLTIPNFIPLQNIVIANPSYTFMINYLLKTFLTDIVDILKSTNNTKFINNIFNSNLKTSRQPYYFQKIVYIYVNTLSGRIILQSLINKLTYYNALVPPDSAIILDVYDVTNCTVFPDALITELTTQITASGLNMEITINKSNGILTFTSTGFINYYFDSTSTILDVLGTYSTLIASSNIYTCSYPLNLLGVKKLLIRSERLAIQAVSSMIMRQQIF